MATEFTDILHESPYRTVRKQLTSICWKMRYVVLMMPQHRDRSIDHLRNWDLWGPMLICLVFAMPLAIVSDNPNYDQAFINVFIIFWIGAALISINCRLLGSKGSIFLIISTVGYCLIPLASIGFLCSLLHSVMPTAVKLVLVTMALSWSTASCCLIMRDLVFDQRKWLCAYPIFLFYIFLAWHCIVG